MATVQTNEITRLSLHLLDEIFGKQAAREVGVRLWDGTCWPDDEPRAAMLVLHHPSALRQMFLGGNEVTMAEAYLHDDFDIEGEIEKIFDLSIAATENTRPLAKKLRVARDLLRLPEGGERLPIQHGPARLTGSRHSIERDRQAIRYHYDVSNDFYQLFLDRHMIYSCGYFQSPEDSLDTAQENKLEYICRKLRLKPGMRLLDIGCGWGGLAMYAAEKYGANVTGITLSENQVSLANERIAAAGLGERCQVLSRDYREMDEDQPFDVLVSVGMFEHVGQALLPEYFAKAWKLLKPGCVFLNHGIALRATEKIDEGPKFDDAYVFPDGELVPVSTTLAVAEETGFEIRDVESLREHYRATLRNWYTRLEANHEQALKYVDEPTYRVWRLYMSGSAHGFDRGRLNLYQSLLVKPEPAGESHLPLTRGDWYRE